MPNSFTFANFEVRTFFSSSYKSNIKSVLGRIRNNLVRALNEHTTLPRTIVVVLDDDVTKTMCHIDNFSYNAGRLVEWLMREFTRCLESYKDMLPRKAKEELLPHAIWIAPATHCLFSHDDNARREKFSKCLATTAAVFPNMSFLRLIKIWDPQERNNFLQEPYRFTSEGLTRYWLAIDSAIRYWNTTIFPKIGKRPPHKSNAGIRHKKAKKYFHKENFNKFHWSHDQNGPFINSKLRRRMPTPP